MAVSAISSQSLELHTELGRHFNDAMVSVGFRGARPSQNVTAAWVVQVTRDLTPPEQAQIPAKHHGWPVVIKRSERPRPLAVDGTSAPQVA